jgi:predicted nucleic acid-binding protein
MSLKVFVDTNVLIDVLARREPCLHCPPSTRAWDVSAALFGEIGINP